jgi:hypothetical protein
MNDTKSMGLRLPVQAAVDRTAAHAALTEGAGVEASQVQNPNLWWLDDFPHPVDPPMFPLLQWANFRSGP